MEDVDRTWWTRAADTTGPVATFFGRATLRLGGYPGRGIIGTAWRKQSRLRGGRSFHVRSTDGTRLAAWYSPALPQPDGVKRLPVLMSHGWCEIKERHFRRAWRLNAQGHDVVLFDHRGHGRSHGKYVTFGVQERHDTAAVADTAIEEGFFGDRFITMGFSLGAGVVIQHAAIDPRVAGVVAMAPFVDFRAAVLSFRDLFAPWMSTEWLLAGFERATHEVDFDFYEASSIRAMRQIEAPMLLIEGGRDRHLPAIDHTQKLLPAKTRGPVEVLCVDDAGHASLCRGAWPELDTAIARFCAGIT